MCSTVLLWWENRPGRRKFSSNFQFSEHTLRLWDKHIKIRISQSHLNTLQRINCMESLFCCMYKRTLYVREFAHEISPTDLLYAFDTRWIRFCSHFLSLNVTLWIGVLCWRCASILLLLIFFFALGRKNYVSGRWRPHMNWRLLSPKPFSS